MAGHGQFKLAFAFAWLRAFIYAVYGSPGPDSSFARFVGAGIFSYWSESSWGMRLFKMVGGGWVQVVALFLRGVR